MGRRIASDRHFAKLAALALAAAVVGAGPVLAQDAKQSGKKAADQGEEGEKPAAAPAQPDPKQLKAAALAAAQKAYADGTKAFQSGKHKDCIPLLTTALGGGGLPGPQMAKALYYRGVANRKIGKPAQAMSDLTTAIWVSGGLNDADRAAAIENRQGAYREAGLGDQAPDVPAATAAPAPAPAPAPPPAVAAAPPPAAAAPAPVAFPPAEVKVAAADSGSGGTAASDAWTATATESASAPAARPAPAESAGIPSPFSDQPSTRTAAVAGPAPVPPPEPAPAPAASSDPSMFEKAGKSISDAGSNVSNFFSGMFGGGSSKSEAPAPTLANDAGAPPPAPAIESQTSSTAIYTAANPDGTADASWGTATEVRSASAKGSDVRTAAIGAPAPAAPAKALKGKFILQVGAVRSRADADAMVYQVKQQHGAALGGREPLVDEAVIGNFGSFHRVRIGPYVDAKEPGKLCSSLIKSGFDCLVVTQ